MYVRIARFEGVQSDTMDSQIEEIRGRIREGRELMQSGEAKGPEADGMRAVKRAMMLVDRQGGRGASVTFADTEEDIMKVHAWMNSMSPAAGGGQRATVEIYEVAIDEQPGQE
jgi:hypothetical protein